MKFDLLKHTHLVAIGGSWSYGLNTETSDVDIKGILIPPLNDYRLGILDTLEEVDGRGELTVYNHLLLPAQKEAMLRDCREKNVSVVSPEGTIYDIKKFFALALNTNPNILEVLWVEPEDILFSTEIGDRLRANREIFFSLKVLYSYRGYAFAQMKKVKTHRGWLLSPVLVEPKREDFGLPPEKSLLSQDEQNAFLWVLAQILKDKIGSFKLSETTREEIEALSIYDAASAGIPEEAWPVIGKITGAPKEFIDIMMKERAYKSARSHWKSYLNWKETRNHKRAALEAKVGFDCYTGDTEFLTAEGWRLFDSITSNTKLATVNPLSLTLEYQNYVERFNGTFSGNLYNMVAHHTDILVTPNHRLFLRKRQRLASGATEKVDNWELREIIFTPDTFDVLIAPSPKTKNYCNRTVFSDQPLPPVMFMKLMGWYLSDGCSTFRKNGEVKDIRISQVKRGHLLECMKKFNRNYPELSSLHKYIHKPNGFRKNECVEKLLVIRDKRIINRIYAECGKKKEKHLPRWVFSLSKRLMGALLDGLMAGDGTKPGADGAETYYSSTKLLANDVQELAFLCGFETSLYGPYSYDEKESIMYHVYINRTRKQYRTLSRHGSLKPILVTEEPIVCFSVPNGTLITRRHGQVSIHGNSKGASHLARLMLQCRDILDSGVLKVRLPKDYKDFIMEIREGHITFDELEKWFYGQEQDLSERAKKSSLPKEPDRKRANEFLIELQLQAEGKTSHLSP
jgi:predicted nucleotidyltransferase